MLLLSKVYSFHKSARAHKQTSAIAYRPRTVGLLSVLSHDTGGSVDTTVSVNKLIKSCLLPRFLSCTLQLLSS